MSGPVAVMSVLLLEAAAGGTVLVWLGGVWGAVRRGFFLLTIAILTLCAWGAWATARAAAVAAPVEQRAVTVLLGFAVSLAVCLLLLVLTQDALARGSCAVAAVIGLVALVAVALARGGRVPLALGELLGGAFFLGSALFGLVLGHWYLVERRLSNRYMIRGASLYAAGVAAAAVSAGLSALNPPAAATGFSPFLALPGFSLLLAAGLVTICALIAVFVWRLAREGGRSIQAATGMFYLAVIMAFSAELSSKVGFF